MNLFENQIIKNIKDYLKDKHINYALMITGGWGSGKTYFVKNILDTELRSKKVNDFPKPIYISLYGISNIEEIEGAILLSIAKEKSNKHSILAKKAVPVASVSVSTIIDIVAPNLRENVEAARSEVFNILSPNLSKYYFIFDDLERCTISIKKTLGYINKLIEHNNAKVLIIANEKEISDNDEYTKTKEKVIGYTLEYTASITAVESLMNQYTDLPFKKEIKEIIKHTLENKEYYNLRTIQQALPLINKVTPILNSIAISNKTKEYVINKLKGEIIKSIILSYIKDKVGKIIDDKNTKGQSYKDFEEKHYINKFDFIKSYIKSRTFNVDSATIEIKAKYDEIYFEQTNPNDPIVKLKFFYILEDDEILNLVKELLDKLSISTISMKFSYIKQALSIIYELTHKNILDKCYKDYIETKVTEYINDDKISPPENIELEYPSYHYEGIIYLNNAEKFLLELLNYKKNLQTNNTIEKLIQKLKNNSLNHDEGFHYEEREIFYKTFRETNTDFFDYIDIDTCIQHLKNSKNEDTVKFARHTAPMLERSLTITPDKTKDNINKFINQLYAQEFESKSKHCYIHREVIPFLESAIKNQSKNI